MGKGAYFILIILFPSYLLLAQVNTLSEVEAKTFVSVDDLFEYTDYNKKGILTDDADASFFKVKEPEIKKIISNRFRFLQLNITHAGKSYDIKLIKNNILTDSFKVYNQNGKRLNYTKAIHYKGIVNDNENSLSAFSFYNGKLRGIVSTLEDGNLIIDKLPNEDVYLSYYDKNLSEIPDFTCSITDKSSMPVINKNAYNSIDCEPFELRKCTRIYYDIGYDVYLAHGSSVQNTVDWMTSVHNVVSVLYADNGLKIALNEISIWQQNDPYNEVDIEDNLNKFKLENPLVNADVAHLIKMDGGGGLAFLNSLCSVNNFALSNVSLNFNDFPLYSFTVKLIAHEMGHSLGSPHTHACFWNGNNTAIDSCGPDNGFSEGCDNGAVPSNGGTIMSYCHLDQTGINFSKGFHPQVEDFLMNNIQSKDCLGNNCIDDELIIATDFELNQPDLTTLNVNINDTIFNSWDFRLYELSVGPLDGFTTTTNQNFQIDNILSNRYYKFNLGTNCIDDDGFDNYKYFQSKEFLSDADWCGFLVFFTDKGGLNGNYEENSEIIKTFYPNSTNEKLTITFLSFDTFQQDKMFVFDGTSVDSPLFTNGELSGNYTTQPSFTATNSDGAITVFFKSYDSAAQTPSGWKAEFSCENFSDDSFKLKDINVFPNPTTDILNIQSDALIDRIDFYDITGKKVIQKTSSVESINTINLNKLSSGVYLLYIKSGENSLVKRIIKK